MAAATLLLCGPIARGGPSGEDPEGNLAVSTGNDKTLKLWDVRTGRLVRTLSGHTHFVRCAAFSPDGSKILTGSGDHTVRIWEALDPAVNWPCWWGSTTGNGWSSPPAATTHPRRRERTGSPPAVSVLALGQSIQAVLLTRGLTEDTTFRVLSRAPWG